MRGYIEQLERERDGMTQVKRQLGMETQQLREEHNQLLSDHEQLKGQLVEAQASQNQTQALKNMQTMVQEIDTFVSHWKRLLGDFSGAGDPAMPSFLPDQSAAQDLWTNQDNEFGLLPNMSLGGI